MHKERERELIIFITQNSTFLGIPDLDLPPIEPLIIPELGMENGQGAVRIKALFSNITVIGAGNYTISKTRIDIQTYRLDLHLAFPKIELEGRYEVVGNVLLFPIQSHGEFWALFGESVTFLKLCSKVFENSLRKFY